MGQGRVLFVLGLEGALLMLLQGADCPQHVGHIVLGQLLARLPLAPLKSLLVLGLLALCCLCCCSFTLCCLALHQGMSPQSQFP